MHNVYPVIKLNIKDYVVVARKSIIANSYLANDDITVLADIPEGHKIAINDIAKGSPVKRYGQLLVLRPKPQKR